jgi:hypothetical protein
MAQDTGIDLDGVTEGLVVDDGVLQPFGSILFADTDADWYSFSVSAQADVACFAHSNHDLPSVAMFAVGDCDNAVASPLAPGDYYVRVVSTLAVTTHGPDRYALVCTVAYP